MAVELKVGLQVQVSLHVSDGKKVSELRPDAGDTRLEATDPVAGPAVAGDLIRTPTLDREATWRLHVC